MMVGGSKLMARRLAAKLLEMGLRTYFLLFPFAEEGVVFHIGAELIKYFSFNRKNIQLS
jgi:D-arabinose 5-phosphate isomerase GutQ